MCGRFTQTAAFDVLAERFGITVEAGTKEELTARYRVDRGRMTDDRTSS
jgi:putative SOS response-associated peptidase YedK